MNISINTKALTVDKADYPLDSIMPSYEGNKVMFNNKFNFADVSQGFQPVSSIINGATGAPFANIDDLREFVKANFTKANGTGEPVGEVNADAVTETASKVFMKSAVARTTGADPLSKSALNTGYASAKSGQVITHTSAGVKYTKLDNSPTGDWDLQPLNLA